MARRRHVSWQVSRGPQFRNHGQHRCSRKHRCSSAGRAGRIGGWKPSGLPPATGDGGRGLSVNRDAGVVVAQGKLHGKLQRPALPLHFADDPDLGPVELVLRLEKIVLLEIRAHGKSAGQVESGLRVLNQEAVVKPIVPPARQEIDAVAGRAKKEVPPEDFHRLKLAAAADLNIALERPRIGDQFGILPREAGFQPVERPREDGGRGAVERRLPILEPQAGVDRFDADRAAGIEPVAEADPLAGTGPASLDVIAGQDRRARHAKDSRVGLARTAGLVVTSGGVEKPCSHHNRYSARTHNLRDTHESPPRRIGSQGSQQQRGGITSAVRRDLGISSADSRLIFRNCAEEISRGRSVSGICRLGSLRLSRTGSSSGGSSPFGGVECGSWSDASIVALHAVTGDCELAGGIPGNHFNGASWALGWQCQ